MVGSAAKGGASADHERPSPVPAARLRVHETQSHGEDHAKNAQDIVGKDSHGLVKVHIDRIQKYGMTSPEADGHGEGKRRRVWTVVAIAALATTIAVGWQRGWLTGLADHEQLIAWMRASGAAGPLICIGIQFMQVVVFAIPGEITQIAAGYVFGAWWGFVYSILGIMLGAAFDFGFARVVGRPMIQRFLGATRLADLDRRLGSRKGLAAVFILFLLPGMPKDAMSYAAGLTSMRLPVFVALSVPARMPALLLSTLFGSNAYDRDYAAMVWIAAAAIVLLVAAALYRWRRQ